MTTGNVTPPGTIRVLAVEERLGDLEYTMAALKSKPDRLDWRLNCVDDIDTPAETRTNEHAELIKEARELAKTITGRICAGHPGDPDLVMTSERATCHRTSKILAALADIVEARDTVFNEALVTAIIKAREANECLHQP